MFVIHGNRTARIKKYTDNQHNCKSCKSFDLSVKVYRDYYHVFFLPLYPVGTKTAKIHCNNCGEPFRVEAIQKQYESAARTPFYLYAGPIVFAGLILFALFADLNDQKEKARFVDNPKVGDVYRVRKDENNSTTYYFLRIRQINGDSVFAYHNNLRYYDFITKLNDDDFFVKEDKLAFTKKELKQMLDKDEINSVERDYGDNEGFNRIK
jgi:hypothetical protein